jgi:tetratricopeptide (TPR) repeat protein
LIIGLIAGFFAANSMNRQAAVYSGTAQTEEPVMSNASPAADRPEGMQADVAVTLEKAESDPQNFAAQMQAGDMYAQIGRFDKAVEYYLRGLNLNPQNVPANVVIANAYFDSHRFEEAEKYYTKVLDLDPKNVNARTDLGATFVERQPPDYDRALLEFHRALEQDAKSAPALYYLGIAQLRKGNATDAEKALAELEKNDPQSELVTRLRQNIRSNTATQ